MMDMQEYTSRKVKLWIDVYIAATNNGDTPATCEKRADLAIDALEKRFEPTKQKGKT